MIFDDLIIIQAKKRIFIKNPNILRIKKIIKIIIKILKIIKLIIN